MTCPRCDGPATTETLQQFGGVCAKCLLDFTAEKDAPAFPGLEIEKVIGEGGMGVVYKAVQKQLGRTVALKVLSPALASDPQFVERFTREAKALAQLSHPNIVQVFDFGVHDGVPFLVMEFVEGIPLRKLLAAKKLTPERALEVVPQICDALAYAHGRGVVHRDVKPENILLDREGRVKIADFGLAKLAEPGQTRITRTQMVMGTPNYMAPEQIENPSTVDHRADIYSLGVVFYEMLTGELPLGRFKAPSQKASVDARLDPVVLRSLEKEPADRYQQATDVKDDVTRVRTGVAPAAPAEPSTRPRFTPAVYWTALPGIICMLTALMLALTGNGKGSAWTAFGGAICLLPAIGIFLNSSRKGREETPVDRAPKSDLARACRVLLIIALVALGVATVLPTPMEYIAIIVAGALFLATLVLSVLTLGWILFSRGRLRGAGSAITAIVVSLVVLTSFTFFTVRSEAPSTPMVRAVVPAPAPAELVRLGQVWPEADELPVGLRFKGEHEGAAALKEAKLPDELLADLAEARYSVIQPGEMELLALRFKSVALERTWTSKRLLEVGNGRWGQTWRDRDRIIFLVGKGKGPDGAVSERLIQEDLTRRLNAPKPAPVRPSYSTRRLIAHKGPFGIAATWPGTEDLQGLAKERERQAGQALYEAGLPEAMLADVAEVRRCLFLEGGLELLGLQFKAEIPRSRWLAHLGFSSTQEQSLSVYILSYGGDARGGIESDAVARSVERVLRKKIDPSYVPPAMADVPGTRVAPFRIDDAWLRPEDLAEGLSLADAKEGDEAFRFGGIPAEAKEDLVRIRSVKVTPGDLYLCGLEFKTELARLRWEQEWPIKGATLHFADGTPAAGGKSLFIFGHDGKPPAAAAYKLVRPVLERRIREAGSVEPKRLRR